jgi:hypothetical protein
MGAVASWCASLFVTTETAIQNVDQFPFPFQTKIISHSKKGQKEVDVHLKSPTVLRKRREVHLNPEHKFQK